MSLHNVLRAIRQKLHLTICFKSMRSFSRAARLEGPRRFPKRKGF
jgi:hypothetical protein